MKQFDILVDEVVDGYVAGEFEGDELERVRNYFFKSRERQEKLRFALALKGRKSRDNSRIQPFPVQPIRRRFTPYLQIAAAVVVMIGAGFVLWRTFRPEPDVREGLIALQAAFREERPIEGRLSDFNYVPLPNQRGGTPAKVDHVQRDIAANLLLKTVRDDPTAAAHQALGKYYLMMHQFDLARQEFTAALALDPRNAKIHNDFGSALLEEGQIQSSATDDGKQLELYGQSLEQFRQALELDSSLLEARFNRALVLQLMKPSNQAKAAWTEYLQRDSTSPWSEEARKNLKRLEQGDRGASPGKIDTVQSFLRAQRESDEDAAWKVVSETYTSAGNDITNSLTDSLLGIQQGSEACDATTALSALTYLAGLENSRAGDRFTFDLVNYYGRAIPKLKPMLATARRHMQTAYSSFEKSKFTEAIREYTKAKVNYEQADDGPGKALVEYRLAHCYVLLPDPARARIAFDRLLLVCERNQYRWLAAQCLFGLAHASADVSEYSKAIRYSDQALLRFEQIGDMNGVLRCLNQLGDFNQAVNHVRTALGYLGRAWGLEKRIPSQPRQRWGTFNQIGFSMTSMQLPAAALFYQKEALDLAIEMSTPLLISRSYSYVGSAYTAMKMYSEALAETTQAFEIGQSDPDYQAGREIMAQASQQLGDIYREAGKCDEAIENYNTSLELYRKLNFDYHAYATEKGKLHCFVALSNNDAVRDELSSVLRRSEELRSKITRESERNSFFDLEQGVYDLAIAYESGMEKDYVKALQYSEQSRARSLLDAVEGGRKIRSTQGGSYSTSPNVSVSLSIAEIQKRMPADAQIVQYAVLDDRLVIWVVTNTAINHEEVPVKTEVLLEKVTKFLDQIKQPPRGADSTTRDRAVDLYSILITPIERYLDKSKVLLIVPDKLLHYLPYAALTSPVTSRYLIEDYDLGLAASGTLFVNLSEAADRKAGSFDEHLLIVGNPSFSRNVFKSLRDLPSSAQESTAVAELYPNHHKLLLQEEATERTVRTEIEKADVAHFAMHFVLDEQSEMLSGFPLTPETSDSNTSQGFDGFLQSYEIYGLNLRRTRLVVLSACQTGIEKQYRGEGAVGAANPFFVAGVPIVVASLWPVDSDASAELMINFHQNRHHSMPVAQALKQSQIEMIHGQNALYRHPYYWAPFLAIGALSRY